MVDARRPLLAAALLGLALALPAGCAMAPAARGVTSTSAQPLEPAVRGMADTILAQANLPGGGARTLAIDPFLERATGTETATTRAMARLVAARLAEQRAGIALRPFTAETLATRPLVLLGAISGVAAAGSDADTHAPPGAYRIWMVLADLGNGRVIGRATAWVQPDAVDPTPTPFHADSPVWLADVSTAAYLRVVNSQPDDAIDLQWARGLRAEALLAEATAAYDAGRPDAALGLFTLAREERSGSRLRAYNGIYLANAALGRRAAAEAAFAELVDYGLGRQRLAVKFRFRPGGAGFLADPAVSGSYPMWLRQIAQRAEAAGACLQVTAHSGAEGSPAETHRLSQARAEGIRARLVAEARDLAKRTEAVGAGAGQPIIGTRRDDATDLLDRRVDFRPLACPQVAQASGGERS